MISEENELINVAYATVLDRETSPTLPERLAKLIETEDPIDVPIVSFDDGVLCISDDCGNGEPFFGKLSWRRHAHCCD